MFALTGEIVHYDRPVDFPPLPRFAVRKRRRPGPALSLSSSKEAEARVGVSCGRSGETGVL
jgi:hypothetical protein